MPNLIVYGVTQSGTLKLTEALREQKASLNYLGNYFDLYGGIYLETVKSGELFTNIKKATPTKNSFIINFTARTGSIESFHDFNHGSKISSEQELQRRVDLLKEADEEHLVYLSAWTDSFDKKNILNKIFKDDNNQIIVVVPDSMEDLLLSQALADQTGISSNLVKLESLSPAQSFKVTKEIFEDVKRELLSLKSRLSEAYKVVKSSELKSKSSALKAVGLSSDSDWSEFASFEPSYKNEKMSYFSNREEIKLMVKELEKIMA